MNFWQYMQERWEIRQRRDAGSPWPWTDDQILQYYSFTEIFREMDKTTIWFRDNVRNDFDNPEKTIFGTILYRWFNRIDVGEVLLREGFFHENWIDVIRLELVLSQWRPKGPWVTGAYMIKTPTGMNKLEGVCWCINQAQHLVNKSYNSRDHDSLEKMHAWLKSFPYLGAFMAYEVVTDLRHTDVLREAPDIMTWANPGPGAKRGLNRVFRRGTNDTVPNQQQINEMRMLLEESKKWWAGPALEMRDIEHTLCEFDKYTRADNAEGRPRNVFKPPHLRAK